MVVISSIVTGDTLIVIPSLLFIGILSGLMNENEINKTILLNIIAFIIGSAISIIISLVTIYYSEGGLFAIAVIQYSWIYILFYTFIGTVGSAIGFYVRDEIKNRG
jgi:hypothetical protein